MKRTRPALPDIGMMDIERQFMQARADRRREEERKAMAGNPDPDFFLLWDGSTPGTNAEATAERFRHFKRDWPTEH